MIATNEKYQKHCSGEPQTEGVADTRAAVLRLTVSAGYGILNILGVRERKVTKLKAPTLQLRKETEVLGGNVMY